MITLEIKNQDIENIFLDGFESNKENFFNFIKDSYNNKMILNSLTKSISQAHMQENGEIADISLSELIDELENNPHSRI